MFATALPEIVTVRLGDPGYAYLIDHLRAPDLAEQMWRDAEHELAEDPHKTWTFAVVAGEPVAWAAATLTDHGGDPELVCSDNYERRGTGRQRRLYPLVYRHRHTSVVAPASTAGIPAVTCLFAQPIPLHEADGWNRTGPHGVSSATGTEHTWWELRRPASPRV